MVDGPEKVRNCWGFFAITHTELLKFHTFPQHRSRHVDILDGNDSFSP